MFKKITITLLAVILVALASKNSYSAIGRWYPYALYPGSVDLFAAVVSKYANKYDVAIILEVYSPAVITSYSIHYTKLYEHRLFLNMSPICHFPCGSVGAARRNNFV